MDLSIVVVNWNTRDMTRDCLLSVRDSLARSPDLAAEIVLVDNASEDGSAGMVAAEFPETVLIRAPRNLGFAGGNNLGFARARGRHVLLLNSDTLAHGTVLADSVAWMDTHADAGAMGCRVLNSDGSVQLTCSRWPSFLNLALQFSGLWKLPRPAWFGRYHMRDWKRDSERGVDVISGCYLLIRAETLARVGPLDESFFFFGEETDWCRRIQADGWRLTFAPVGEITHFGGGSVKRLNARRDVMLTEATVRLHRKHGGVLQAAAVWTLLAAFNASRAILWGAASLGGGAHARERARHFRQVLTASCRAWPKGA